MSTRCSICGRKLTNAESIARGVGPVCSKKYGIPSKRAFTRQQTISQYVDDNSC